MRRQCGAILLLALVASAAAFAPTPALRGLRTLPQSTCMRLKSEGPEDPPVSAVKEMWIKVESFLVGLTQGTGMAEAMDKMEHARLFPKQIKDAHDRLVQGSKTMMRRLGEQTADMRDMYEAVFADQTPHPEKEVLWRRNVQPSFKDLQLAPVADLYSGFYDQSEMELSGGYHEGDGDDLPLIKQLVCDDNHTPERLRYSAESLRRRYGDQALFENDDA